MHFPQKNHVYLNFYSGGSSKRQEPIYAKVKKGIRFADDVEDEGNHGKETVTTTTTTTKTVTVQKEKRMKSKEGRGKTEMTNGSSSSGKGDKAVRCLKIQGQ